MNEPAAITAYKNTMQDLVTRDYGGLRLMLTYTEHRFPDKTPKRTFAQRSLPVIQRLNHNHNCQSQTTELAGYSVTTNKIKRKNTLLSVLQRQIFSGSPQHFLLWNVGNLKSIVVVCLLRRNRMKRNRLIVEITGGNQTHAIPTSNNPANTASRRMAINAY